MAWWNPFSWGKKQQVQPDSSSWYRRGYAGAIFNRLTAGWKAFSTSQDAETYVALKVLRNRSRDLVRNNDYAKGALRIITNNVVGRGITLQSQVKRRRGNKLDDKVNAQIEAAWEEWSKKRYCHVAGKLSFKQIQRLVMRSVVESGEVLIRFVEKSFDGSPVPLALEIIEADQLCEEDSLLLSRNGNQIRMGVEVDRWGRPVNYWIYPTHPGDAHFGPTSPTPEPIPAEEILHIYVCERPGQTRGVPWLHSGIMRLKNLGGAEEAEVVAMRVAANYMGFIKTLDVEGTIAANPQGDGGKSEYYMEPGMIDVLGPGEDFVGFTPNRPNQGIAPFAQHLIRGFGVGQGIDYSTQSNDLSQTSYSSARVGLINERDGWQILQDWLIEELCQPIFERWLDRAVMAGVLNLPNYEVMEKFYCCPRWIPRGWFWIDPYKETVSSILGIRSGLTTLTRELARQGLDIEAILHERKHELDLAATLGVPLDVDVSKPSAVRPSNQSSTGDSTDDENLDDPKED